METVTLTGAPLTIEQVAAVALSDPPVRVDVSAEGADRARASRRRLEEMESSGELIYGVNTGFGALKSVVIAPEDRVQLQANLIRSHAVGVGPPLPKSEVRAAMLLLAASLLRGASGAGPEASQKICEFLNGDVIPTVPSRGSLGSSGDLAPLSHLARALIGDDVPLSNPSRRPAPLQIQSKLGLSLINGTHFHTGIAAILSHRAKTLAKAADIALAMNLEAMLGSAKPFGDEVNRLRPHQNQAAVAENVRHLIEGSDLVMSHQFCAEVQDAYSLRCAPQVHGAARNAFAHLRDVVEIELGSVTDNPLLADGGVVSAGHFHGEPVGLALDYCKIGLAELASISERRSERALNKEHNRGLPAFLIPNPGLNSGLMMLQYTAASLVSENKTLCHPASVDSIPTGANQEDHNSMAMTAALHARQIADNLELVLAIELLIAAQALDCRAELQAETPGPGVRAAWKTVREQSEHVSHDRPLAEDVENLSIPRIVEAVEAEVGELR